MDPPRHSNDDDTLVAHLLFWIAEDLEKFPKEITSEPTYWAARKADRNNVWATFQKHQIKKRAGAPLFFFCTDFKTVGFIIVAPLEPSHN
jgi:hypothetical protein